MRHLLPILIFDLAYVSYALDRGSFAIAHSRANRWPSCPGGRTETRARAIDAPLRLRRSRAFERLPVVAVRPRNPRSAASARMTAWD